MIERYARKEMSDKWTMQAKYQAWLDVELAVVQGWAKLGKIPKEDAQKIVKNAGFMLNELMKLKLLLGMI